MPKIVSVSSKGWVVIPKELRKRHNIRPGSKVLFIEAEDGLTLVPLAKDPIKNLKGVLKGYPLVDDLLEMRRQEAAGEEIRIGQSCNTDVSNGSDRQ
ncbi:MAG TPA: AbrB/MazE/SpoVT family DNA-binding domain-containing protein [Clostridia bacterium]|nr:AbrB/MazE/SpoVT family DNA-binding domain-containing protein [Clostridia bacterium]